MLETIHSAAADSVPEPGIEGSSTAADCLGVASEAPCLNDIGIYMATRICRSLITVRMGEFLAPHGLSSLGYLTLLALSECPEGKANPSSLSDVIGELPSNLTRICDGLISKGLMRRHRSQLDRRRIDLSLTDRGMRLLRVVGPIGRRDANEFFARNFTPEEESTLLSLLRRFADGLAPV